MLSDPTVMSLVRVFWPSNIQIYYMTKKAANPHIWEADIGEYVAFLLETTESIIKIASD